MFKRILCLLILPVTAFAQDTTVIRSIYDYALTESSAYARLDYICNQIGPRLTGTPNAQRAVDYTLAELKKSGADSVWLQPVKVEYWERGVQEKAWYQLNGKKVPLNVCALGGSIATPENGIEKEIVEVHSFDDLAKLGRKNVEGKIVFINRVLNPKNINPLTSYGECGTYRYNGAKEAAIYGASGVIVRSLNVGISDYPHTGAMGYIDTIPKIPACAISTRDADKLSAALKADPTLKAGFKQSCKSNGEVLSYNVIAELRGLEFPEEYILAGAHLDSWDLATGAHDDGAGVVQCMEMISIFKNLQLKPKRTIRCVLFMNEENGGRGAIRYAAVADSLHQKHIAAIESDRGGFSPRGFAFDGDSLKIANTIRRYENLLHPFLLQEWSKGYAGTDIAKLKPQGTLLIGYVPDAQRYLDIHHNAADTFDKVSKRELELGAASIASMVWMLSQNGLKE